MKSLLAALEFNKKDLPVYIILLSAPVLLTLYRYHGYAEYFRRYFAFLANDPLFEWYGYLWQFGIFFILMFLLPVGLIIFVFKRPLADFGIGLGDIRNGLKTLLITIPLLVIPLMYLASKMPDVRAEYPLLKMLMFRHDLIFWHEAAYVLFYYSAWEFYFRGFLLFGLKARFGNMNAILIQTVSSCLIHIGKPEGEIIGSIIIGIIFGAIALRTRSIWYVMVLHALIGLLTDLFIIFL